MASTTIPPNTPKNSSKTFLGLVAALIVTGAVAAYGMVSTLSLRTEIDALKTSISESQVPPLALPAQGEEVVEDNLGEGSNEDRLIALEEKIRNHARSIDALSIHVARTATGGDLPLDENGEIDASTAEKLREFYKGERQRERQERTERRFEEATLALTDTSTKFVQDHSLSRDVELALGEINTSTQESVRALMESVQNGDLSWREARPEMRATWEDSFAQLQTLLGDELTDDYLNRLGEEMPFLNRIRSQGRRGNAQR